MVYDFKAEIVKAKNSGSAKSGSHHWLLQRVTGIILALCSVWLIYFTLTNKNNDINIIMLWDFKKPFNVVALLITVVISLYHAMLGMRVVIEDYISYHKLRNTLIIIVQLFCTVTIVAFVVVLFYKGQKLSYRGLTAVSRKQYCVLNYWTPWSSHGVTEVDNSRIKIVKN